MEWMGEYTLETKASPERVWERWTRPEHWAADDLDVVWARLDGPLTVGVSGVVKPRRGPATKLTVTELQPPFGFTTETRLPMGRLYFEHTLEETLSGIRFTHRVRIVGPLSLLFGRLIGRKIVAGLPNVMGNIATASGDTDGESVTSCISSTTEGGHLS